MKAKESAERSIRTSFTLVLTLLLGLAMFSCNTQEDQVNILWLMTDEQRADALGCSGTSWVQTPNLDRLGSEGVVFENAYTQSPVCTPARINILTGKYCSQTNIWRNVGPHHIELDHLTHIFREAGYRSATFGKQHYGGPKRAFDKEVSLVTSEFVDPYGYDKRYDESKYDVVKFPDKWVLGGRFPEAADKSREAECVQGAKKWLQEGSKEEPFLLRLSFSAPHTPVVPPIPFDTLIKEADIDLPEEADPLPPGCPVWIKSGIQEWGDWPFTPEQIRKMRRYYYGYVAFVDDQFGQLINWMDENGYLDNTIIVFVSDHGTHLCDHGRVQKQTFYEPSVKVPYFFWYPKSVAKGVKLKTPVEIRSLLPTLLELAGFEVPAHVSDISLATSLKQGSEPRARPIFSEMSFTFDPRHPDNRVVMVRDGDWKLSYCVDSRDERGELINLKEDPHEQHNLFGGNDTKIIQEKLIDLIDEHLRGTDKPFRNVVVLDELLKDDANHVICPTCRRQRVMKFSDPEEAPDWAEGLSESHRCKHCGTRFGLQNPVKQSANKTDPEKITVASYYFPNYHSTDARMNELKGKGWSEWELVKQARPRFNGHQQPKVPLWGYADESSPAVMSQKIEAAATHGIDVFIFDWYWDNKGIYWERGLEEGFMQAPNNHQLQFALMWAMWDFYDLFPYRRDQALKILYPGKVTRETFESACDYIIEKYFKHPSYWKIDDRPYFSFYDLDLLVESFGSVKSARKALDAFRDRARQAGFPDIHFNAIVKQHVNLLMEKKTENPADLIRQLGFNSVTSYVWIHHVELPELETDYRYVQDEYFKFWTKAEEIFEIPYYPNVTMGWDPSPRTDQDEPYGNFGYPFTNTISGNTPERFQRALQATRHRLEKSEGSRILNINCWNEWTEGSYLEPDRRHGYGYLQAVKEVFSD